VTTIKRRRVEITIFERERVVRQPATVRCPMCRLDSELLTPEQAGDLARVEVQSIYRWLAEGKAHGLKTQGGQDLVCKNSLFQDCEG
jgi:hypothetical protein